MAPRTSERAGRAGSNGRSPGTTLIVGGEPRADLLPPEVSQAAKGRTYRRIMVLVTVLVLVAVAGVSVLAYILAQNSRTELDLANARTADLLAKQSKYVEVQQVTTMVKLAETARAVGMSTDIDWSAYLKAVEGALPPGATITRFGVVSATPVTPFPAPDAPLQGERVASITLSAVTSTLPDVKVWLESLAELTGYADAWPDVVTLSDGVYQVSITMHINSEALTNRFPAPASVTAGGN